MYTNEAKSCMQSHRRLVWMAYEALGKSTMVTDGNMQSHRRLVWMAYEALGKSTMVTDGNMQSHRRLVWMAYEALGKPTMVTDGNKINSHYRRESINIWLSDKNTRHFKRQQTCKNVVILIGVNNCNCPLDDNILKQNWKFTTMIKKKNKKKKK